MAKKAYGWQHQKRRKELLVPGAVCYSCGKPATELDHDPPLSKHVHEDGSGCCRYRTSCFDCGRKQGGKLGVIAARWHSDPVPQFSIDVEAGVVGRGPKDRIWDVPWLKDLRKVPAQGIWPRFMSAPHPDAVGSYGADVVAWLAAEAGITLRWWQALAITRQLEHDADGDLCWLEVLPTTARQSGKSVLLRAGAIWRLHQAPLFGEAQLIMHTAKDLQIAREVRREAKAWAIEHGYEHREANGQEEIIEPLSGSRWLVRGKGSIYGYSVSYALVDEVWGLPADVIENGLWPTMLERAAPQMVLASTANRKATPLFPGRRAQALAELDLPGSVLLMEWSAPRDVNIEDRDAWRLASPHWSPGRERLLEAQLAKVLAGQSLDPDEDDPIESFRCQYLDSWLPEVVTDVGEPIIDAAAWARARGSVTPVRVHAAVEDFYGKGFAVAVVAREGDRFEVDGRLYDTWAEVVKHVRALFDEYPHGRVLYGPSIWEREGGSDLPNAKAVGPSETRTGLSVLRQLFAAGRICHDRTPELDRQLKAVKVRELSSGMNLVPGQRADLVKATVWALQAAHRQRSPGIH